MTLSSEETARRSAVRKFFQRMIPLLVLMLVVNQMDRTNIGFIRESLQTDVGIGAAAYGLGAGLFFLSYAIFEVPSNLMLQRIGARVWLTRIMISWGVVIAAMSLTTDVTTFYVFRFLLGIAEAGFFPGVMYYFTTWLPNAERGRASAIFLGGSTAAYVVTGPITGALLELDGAGGLAGWRWMFLLEGGLSVLLGVLAGFVLVSRIGDAKWLNPSERAALGAAVEADRAMRDDGARRRQGWRAVLNPQVLLLCWTFFAMSLCGYSITFWLPSAVGKIPGLSDFGVGLLSAVPWICALIAMYSLARLTDRTGVRRPWVAVGLLLGALGTYLATMGSPWFGLVAMCIAAVGFKCAASAFWPMSQHTLEVNTAAAAIALINSLGNLGGFVGPTVLGLFQQFTGSTHGGLYLMASVSVLAAGMVWLIRARADTRGTESRTQQRGVSRRTSSTQ